MGRGKVEGGGGIPNVPRTVHSSSRTVGPGRFVWQLWQKLAGKKATVFRRAAGDFRGEAIFFLLAAVAAAAAVNVAAAAICACSQHNIEYSICCIVHGLAGSLAAAAVAAKHFGKVGFFL